MRLFKNVLHLTVALFLFGAGTAAAVDPVFDPLRLHEVRVEIDPADWAALKATFQTNQYYAANVTIDGELVRQVGIRSRGKGSRSGTKPGIKIDMNKYVAGQEEEGWLLLEKVYQGRDRTQFFGKLREFLVNSGYASK